MAFEPVAGPAGPTRPGRVGTGFTTAPGGHRTFTPQSYAEALSECADQTADTSLLPGLHFKNLSEFLLLNSSDRRSRAPSSRVSARTPSPGDRFAFLTVYNLDGSTASKQPTLYHDPDTLPSTVSDKPSILFLRGTPTPAWLSRLGAVYRVDPEFFNRHLDFYSTSGRRDCFHLPSLPSAQALIFDLPYVTLGQVSPAPAEGRRVLQSNIDSLRQQAGARFDDYLHWLCQLDRNIEMGESIVRKYNVHDHVHSSLEQRISIALNKTQGTWQLLVWLDTGRPLSQSPRRPPWLKPLNETQPSQYHVLTLVPTIRVHQLAALRALQYKVLGVRNRDFEPGQEAARVPTRPSTQPQRREGTEELTQILFHMHDNYGRHLDPATMAADPFYALSEIFHLVAAGYKQYLNMLEQKDSERKAGSFSIDSQLSNPSEVDPGQWNSTNLRYDQAALERHLPQLRSIVGIIRHGSSIDPSPSHWRAWPHSTPPGSDSFASKSAYSLLQDFEDLSAHAERLLLRYKDGMALLMNRAVMDEAAKSVEQAREVTKLTRLAFVYIPLSFTASFFGMNLRELGRWGGVDGFPPIWIWFAVSAPVLLVSLALMRWDVEALTRGTVAWFTRVCSGKMRRRRGGIV